MTRMFTGLKNNEARAHSAGARRVLRVLFFLSAFFLASLGIVFSQAVTTAGQIVEGLRLPLLRHDNGRVKAMLLADKAWMTDTGVSAEGNLTVYLMTEEGLTNGVAWAEKGSFNQTSRVARCTGAVMMEKDGTRLSGTDMIWMADSNKVWIVKDAMLVLARGGKSVVEGL